MAVSLSIHNYSRGKVSLSDLFPKLSQETIEQVWLVTCSYIEKEQWGLERRSLLGRCTVEMARENAPASHWLLRIKVLDPTKMNRVVKGSNKILRKALFFNSDTKEVVPMACLETRIESGRKEWDVCRRLRNNSACSQVPESILIPNFKVEFFSEKEQEMKCRLYSLYCRKGSLWNFLLRNRPVFYRDEWVYAFGKSALQAIDFFHKNGLVYGDLKVNNLVVSRYSPRHFRLHLIDFGSVTEGNERGLNQTSSIDTTYAALAPEVFLCAPDLFCEADEKKLSIEGLLRKKEDLLHEVERGQCDNPYVTQALALDMDDTKRRVELAQKAQSQKIDQWGLGIVLAAILFEYFQKVDNELVDEVDLNFWKCITSIKEVTYGIHPLQVLTSTFTDLATLQEPKHPVLHYLWRHFFQMDPQRRSQVETAMQEWESFFKGP